MGRWLCYSSLLLFLLLRCTSFRVRGWLSSASLECPCRACVSQQRSQVRFVCLAGWLAGESTRLWSVVVGRHRDRPGWSQGQGQRERERENLRPITLSISNGAFPRLMSTRDLSTYTQSTRSHARRDRGRGRETEREWVCNRDRLTTQLSLLCSVGHRRHRGGGWCCRKLFSKQPINIKRNKTRNVNENKT